MLKSRVSLYIRRANPTRHYERVRRTNPQQCNEGDVYCLRYEVDGKRKWETLTMTNLNEASAAHFRKESELCVKSKAESRDPKPSAPARRTLQEQREAFLARKAQRNVKTGDFLVKETQSGYKLLTEEFIRVVDRQYAVEITGADVTDVWIQALYERGLSQRSVCNYYVGLAHFLGFCGIDHKKLVDKDQRPTFVEEDPEAYDEDQIAKFFAACENERDALYFELLLKTGVRELEGAFCEWSDILVRREDGEDSIVFNVHNKPELGWKTKTRKSREVPLEKGLYLKLKIWQTKRPDTRFIFGTSSDAVNWHFLRACKATAKRAGLNEADFWLHKFRDTFATWSLRRGANIRDVQGWLGHSKIEMTERYLEKGKGKYAQQKINQAWGSVNFGVAAVGAD
jgi:integrase